MKNCPDCKWWRSVLLEVINKSFWGTTLLIIAWLILIRPLERNTNIHFNSIWNVLHGKTERPPQGTKYITVGDNVYLNLEARKDGTMILVAKKNENFIRKED